MPVYPTEATIKSGSSSVQKLGKSTNEEEKK